MIVRASLVAVLLLAAPVHAQLGGTTEGGTQPPQAVEVPVPAPEGPPAPVEDVPVPKPAPSRVTAVTVYRGTALVTRDVAVPEGEGLVEVVVTPLPPATIDSSLYTEGEDGLRVLSTRYRSRAVRQDTRQEVAAKEQEIKEFEAEAERMQQDVQVIEANLQLLQKLENFTAVTMQGLAEKGMLDGKATIELSRYVMTSREEASARRVELQQGLKANAESVAFARRQLTELAAGSSRTEIDAVIVVDRADAAAGTVHLNYLVGAATWHPQYRFRAGQPGDPVQLQYLAAIAQQTGEEWGDAQVTLSTAQPMLDAAPPKLLPLDVAVARLEGDEQTPESGSQMMSGVGGMGGGMGGMGGMGGGMGGMGGMGFSMEQYRAQAQQMRGQAQREMIGKHTEAGGALLNSAAALDQAQELLARDDEGAEHDPGPDLAGMGSTPSDGPSVTYHLKSRLTVPSRNDPQLIEVARLELEPDYFAKAVPVLTTRVYRLANLTNSSDYILLPGEATVYVDSDFVGRMSLPLVAIGERFTVGFGIDPQLQVGRRLVRKTRNLQGGNQVHSYEFRIAVRSYRPEPVRLQVWDRLPRAQSEAVAVNLVQTEPPLSEDPSYVRLAKPDNLLRWDLVVPPTIGEEPLNLSYQFKLEYARDYAITQFQAGGKVAGLMEAPTGFMEGMGGGGFRSMPAPGSD